MKDWIKFINANRKWLSLGFFLSFFSSYGQTFMISIYLPFILISVGITNTFFGILFSIATIMSAITLPFFGKFIDKMQITNFALIVFSGLSLSMVLFSQAGSIYLLFPGLFLLRVFGQGLMTHTAATGISKVFLENRGKALSIVSLGHPAGQIFFPLITLPLIALSGWRLSLIIGAIFTWIVLFLINSSIAKAPTLSVFKLTKLKNIAKTKKEVANLPYKTLISDGKFWIISINSFILPFLITAIFLYQFTLGTEKGWSENWITLSFAFYGVFTAVGMILSGYLIDRYSGMFMFPIYLIPMLIGLLLISYSDNLFVAPVFYGLTGISSGLGGPIKTALQAEVYGVSQLGKIRSVFTSLLVISTALGPPTFGYLIDSNMTFNGIFLICFFVVLVCMLISFRLWKYGKK